MTDDAQRKIAAWLQAEETADPMIRIDCDRRHIHWGEYGKFSDLGWQIDHAMPTVLGGGGHHANLRARHWRGNSLAGGLLGALRKQP
jgi:hypothetical protein